MVFLTLAPVNKPIKFELKAYHIYNFCYFFIYIYIKDMYVSYTIFTFHNQNQNPQIKYTVKSSREKKREEPTNKFKRVHNFF
jgi:hypothetical protein